MGVADAGRDLGPLIDAVKARSRTILQVAEQVAVRLDPSRPTLDAKGEALMRKMGPAFAGQPAAGGPRRSSALIRGRVERRADRSRALKARGGGARAQAGDVMQPVRVALTGSTVSEPVNELLAVVGRERSLGAAGGHGAPRLAAARGAA